MTKEEKKLLLRDLRGRLPSGDSPNFTLGIFKWKDDDPVEREIDGTLYDRLYLQLCVYNTDNMSFKPYLRPMSSMTEEEIKEYDEQIKKDNDYFGKVFEQPYACMIGLNALDYLLSNHFDFRELIPMGLALEAPEGMYKTE